MKQQNKVAAITGATGGIGRELVKLLDKKGERLKIFEAVRPRWINCVDSPSDVVRQTIAAIEKNKSDGVEALIKASDAIKSIDEMFQTVDAPSPDCARISHWHSVGSFAENKLQANTGKVDRIAIRNHHASIINSPTVRESPGEQVSMCHV